MLQASSPRKLAKLFPEEAPDRNEAGGHETFLQQLKSSTGKEIYLPFSHNTLLAGKFGQ